MKAKKTWRHLRHQATIPPKWGSVHRNFLRIHRAGVMVKRGQSPWEVVKVRTRSNNWNKGLEAWRWFPKKFRPSVSNVQAMSRSRGSVLCRGDLRYQKFLFFPRAWENLSSISCILRLFASPIPSWTHLPSWLASDGGIHRPNLVTCKFGHAPRLETRDQICYRLQSRALLLAIPTFPTAR